MKLLANALNKILITYYIDTYLKIYHNFVAQIRLASGRQANLEIDWQASE